MARRGDPELLARAAGARSGAAHRDPADCRHPPAQPPARRRLARDDRARRTSQGARRARDADRSRAQRSREGVRAGHGARRRVHEHRVLHPRAPHRVQRERRARRRGHAHRRGARRVPGRNHHGLSEVPLHADHRGARGGRTRGVHRLARLSDARRAARSQHSHPLDDALRAAAQLPRRRRHRGRLRSRARARGDARQGAGAARGPGGLPVNPELVWVNGRPSGEVSALDRGLHFGDGLFETIGCVHGAPRFLELHLERLAAGSQRLGLEAPRGGTLEAEVRALAAESPRSIIKMLVTRGAAVARGYAPSAAERPTRITLRYAWPEEDPALWHEGVRVRVADQRLGENPALAGLKHCNRLEQVLARAEWTDPGIAEALMYSSSGALISGTMSNVFLVRDERLSTPRAVELYLRLRGLRPRVQAGNYEIPPHASPEEIIALFEQGKVVLEQLTVVEGATFNDFLAALDQHPRVLHTLRGKSPAAIMGALGHPGVSPEGEFFPDTYRFAANTPDIAILTLAYDSMQRVLADAWTERRPGLPYDTPYQALTLASMVEKEAALKSERAQIAGVFVNRLRKRMRLQSDPTVVYGLGAR